MNGFERQRRKKDLTQAALAEILKVDQTAVSQWERGESKPRADKLPELARILNCSVDELLKPDEPVAPQ